MPDLLEYLESFNRKERFFLVGHALGNPAFTLAPEFRASLKETFHLTVPEEAFVAMDYHLDWIHASLYLASSGADETQPQPNGERIVAGNQEDTDLLVAFRDTQTVHLLLLEAKAETSWSNSQMRSKVERLTKIFGPDGGRYAGVRPYLGLMSPNPPRQLDSRQWPDWMKRDGTPIWLKLNIAKNRRRPTRWDKARKRPSKTGGHFRVIRSRWSDA